MSRCVYSATFCLQSGSIGSDSGADCYRMRRAQNRRSQFPQRYCLIETNLNNLSSKSRRRARLIRSLLQSGHVITRKCLYSLIGRSKYPISAYVVPRLDGAEFKPNQKERRLFPCAQAGELAPFPFWAAIQGACQGIQQTVVCLWANESRTREEPPPERRPAATPAWRVLLRSSVLQ